MKAWIFDIDGVLTDLNTKEVSSPIIFRELIHKLHQGDIIGFNTGRSANFVIDKILKPLESQIDDQALLSRVITLAEKGGVALSYDDHAHLSESIKADLMPPQHLATAVEQLVSQSPYRESMFFDKTKRTMISIEMISDKQLQFNQRQPLFLQDIDHLIHNLNLDDQLKVETTSIAIDIQSPTAGKGYAATIFIEMLKHKNLNISECVSFGDSPSDYEMHEVFSAHFQVAKFVYVAANQDLTGKNLDHVIFTRQKFTQGTLEYLNS